MERRDACLPLLWLGIAGLLLSLLGGIYLGPGSAKKIEAKIESQVAQSLTSGGFSDWARAKVDGQKVVLHGLAPSDADERAAIRAALTSAGAGGLIAGGVTKVVDRIDVAPHVNPYRWSALKKDGALILSGHAPDRDAMAEIVEAARSIYGDAVENQMTLASGAPQDGDWVDIARLGLGQIRALEPGEAVLIDTDLTISGAARNVETIGDLESAMIAVAPPFSAVSHVTGPYHWSARHDGSVMILDGAVPSEVARNELVRTARVNFSGQVVDHMTIDPRSGWDDVAKLGLEHLGRFKKGEINLVGDTFFISGDAPESAYEYLSEDVKRIPRPYSAQIDVNTIAPELSELAGVNLDVEGPRKQQACQEAFMRVMSANRIFFTTASSDIDRKSGETLDKLVAVARDCSDMSIMIEGHTDDRGSREMNLDLSERRAEAVRDYFVSRGMEPDRLKAVGYGPARPADTNDTPEGRRNNRRIEFKVAIEEDR